jgi:hypothetical protein
VAQPVGWWSDLASGPPLSGSGLRDRHDGLGAASLANWAAAELLVGGTAKDRFLCRLTRTVEPDGAHYMGRCGIEASHARQNASMSPGRPSETRMCLSKEG